MRVLLDTQLLYWWFYETSRLPIAAVESIRSADEVFYSAASIWEIAIKVRLAKMSADPSKIVSLAEQNDFRELPVRSKHAMSVSALPMHHRDPFDRLLMAQAMSEPLQLLTVDAQLKPYSELVVCFD